MAPAWANCRNLERLIGFVAWFSVSETPAKRRRRVAAGHSACSPPASGSRRRPSGPGLDSLMPAALFFQRCGPQIDSVLGARLFAVDRDRRIWSLIRNLELVRHDSRA